MGLLSGYGWSKECPDCGRRYESTCGIAACLVCKKELAQTKKMPTVDSEEFRFLSYAHGRSGLSALTKEEREQWDRDWEVLEHRAEMAAPWLSIADLFAAWPASVRAA